jgi:hypothetical protein
MIYKVASHLFCSLFYWVVGIQQTTRFWLQNNTRFALDMWGQPTQNIDFSVLSKEPEKIILPLIEELFCTIRRKHADAQ